MLGSKRDVPRNVFRREVEVVMLEVMSAAWEVDAGVEMVRVEMSSGRVGGVRKASYLVNFK